ncbi:MAG: heparinase II/III family protein [Cellvibrionaceae bacterium]
MKFVDFTWQAVGYSEQCFFVKDKVRFLGKEGILSSAESWNSTLKEKLWLYNAHYFDDLNAIDNETRYQLQFDLIRRWIKENPPVEGNGWEPYPLSLRIVNWIKWLSRHKVQSETILLSLNQQAEALFQQLEYHILGNHLFANAKALVFLGVYLDSNTSEKYLTKGLNLIVREVEEQFLKDGGHFERSPMYHEILLWDVLDLIHLSQVSKNKKLNEIESVLINTAKKALSWLKVMSHPDGEISFFNDAAIGIAAPPATIESYYLSLIPQKKNFVSDVNKDGMLITLDDSGYSRVSMPNHVTLFDHGPVGPDYLPGHAHADTLSFEWSVGKQRVLVNSGTSLYGLSEERSRQRKTAAHNTVVINDEDSSVVWGGFRVAQRARAILESSSCAEGKVELVASHDGYKRLRGKPVHRRKVILEKDSLEVIDSIDGKFKTAFAFFHIHPDISVEKTKNSIVLVLPNQKIISVVSEQNLGVEETTWHPNFGVSVNNVKIRLTLSPSSNIKFFLN